MNSVVGPCMILFLSFLLIVGGAYTIITGSGGSYWGVPVPAWSGWVFLPLGVYICVLCIRALRRGEWKRKEEAKKYTEEDAIRAKEQLDRMYLKEHGSLPEESTPGEAKPEEAPSKTASGQSVLAPKTNGNIRQGLLTMLAGVVLFLTGNMVMMIMAAALFLFGLCRLARGLMEAA